MHGPSQLYDQSAFFWTDRSWTGRQLPGSVLYELHVGTFTEAGTFDTAIGRLDHLAELGVDLVEVLPVNAVDGPRNWGYDGVGWYAVTENYGGPDAFKRFVDACHLRGMGVVLDVVYNHLGPSGAYLDRFGPYFAGSNIWGPTVNLDGSLSEPVRRYVIDNALLWLRDFHVDGLRLDAVHALRDTRATHVLEQLSAEVEALSAHVGRPLSLIAESDLNDARLVTAREGGGYGLTAQWCDDVHHSLHTTLTGEAQGYYADFATAGLTGLAHVLTRAFLHEGTWSSFRQRNHGAPVDTRRIPAHRFVVYLQNHDQIGNRATGDRLTHTLSPGLLACGAALVFTSAFTPMLFMGEEWGARTPWQFFSHFPDAGAARRGAGGAHRGVRRARLGRRRRARPQRRVHLPRLQARLDRARAGAARHAPAHAPRADRAAPGVAGADRPVARRRGGGRRRRGAHRRGAPWPDPGGVQPRGRARLDPGRPDRCHPAGFGAGRGLRRRAQAAAGVLRDRAGQMRP